MEGAWIGKLHTTMGTWPLPLRRGMRRVGPHASGMGTAPDGGTAPNGGIGTTPNGGIGTTLCVGIGTATNGGIGIGIALAGTTWRNQRRNRNRFVLRYIFSAP
jgi:hypothetical protein